MILISWCWKLLGESAALVGPELGRSGFPIFRVEGATRRLVKIISYFRILHIYMIRAMPLSPLDIKKKEFEQKMRGYDVDQVRAFLDEVAQEFELALRDQYQVEDEIEAMRKKLEHYIALESTLEKTLLAAQQTAIKIDENAKREAELLLGEARLERDKMMRELPLEIEKARGEVTRLRAEYDATLARMRSMMDGFGAFLHSMTKETSDR